MMDLSLKLTERTGETNDYGHEKHDTVLEIDARVHGTSEAARRLIAIADMLETVVVEPLDELRSKLAGESL